MIKTSKKIVKSFKDAIKGILYIFKTQRNFRIQVVCFVIATSTAFILKLSFAEIAVIIFAGGLVMIGEMINTGMETLVDLISPDYHPLAGRIKDIAAGAVLVSSIIAVIIGIIIFLPVILNLF